MPRRGHGELSPDNRNPERELFLEQLEQLNSLKGWGLKPLKQKPVHDEESETAADNVREDIVIERNYDLKDEDYLNKYDSDGSSEDDDLYPPLPHHHPTTTTTTTTTTTPRPAVVTTTFPPWRREYPAEQPDSVRPQHSMRQLEQPRPEYPALQPVRRPEYPATRQEQPPQPPPVPPLPPQPDPYELRRQMEEERRRRIQEHYDRYQEHLRAFEARRMGATSSSTTTTTTSTTTTTTTASTSVAVPARPVFSETAVQQRTEDQRPDSRRLSFEELERQRHEEMLRREQERIMERARAQAEARARLIKPNVTQPRAWIKVPSGEEKPADDRPPPPVLPFRRYRPFDLNVVTTKQVIDMIFWTQNKTPLEGHKARVIQKPVVNGKKRRTQSDHYDDPKTHHDESTNNVNNNNNVHNHYVNNHFNNDDTDNDDTGNDDADDNVHDDANDDHHNYVDDVHNNNADHKEDDHCSEEKDDDNNVGQTSFDGSSKVVYHYQ
ncbi:unnamed protein product [Haemonchus placei]|uniref:Protein CASC3 n=1 Tax=Haemonchus placei TaxID=6290 RepID=A0A0N4WM53_HAEPC|nr:unnamed protein product [Haemonchus placei]